MTGLAVSITDAVVEVVEYILERPCPGRKLCTGHRAMILWTVEDILRRDQHGDKVEPS